MTQRWNGSEVLWIVSFFVRFQYSHHLTLPPYIWNLASAQQLLKICRIHFFVTRSKCLIYFVRIPSKADDFPLLLCFITLFNSGTLKVVVRSFLFSWSSFRSFGLLPLLIAFQFRSSAIRLAEILYWSLVRRLSSLHWTEISIYWKISKFQYESSKYRFDILRIRTPLLRIIKIGEKTQRYSEIIY